MNTLAIELHPLAHTVKCTDVDLIVELLDGRTISAPLVWFPRLLQATQEHNLLIGSCLVMAFIGLT